LINKIKSTNLIFKIANQTMDYTIDEKLKREEKSMSLDEPKDEIQEWAKTIKDIASSYSSFHLTDAQRLSCIILLKANTNKTMLLQVGTGENEKQNLPSQNREEHSRIYNTIREQIGQNAKDYTIAYSQCEMIHNAKYSVKTNLQANISDILTLAKKHGLELKLVNDVNYAPIHQDKTKCISIVPYNKRDRDNHENIKVEHFELMSNHT
ncbi:unnamed protein product, partial [Rotaria sp. Silwood2]